MNEIKRTEIQVDYQHYISGKPKIYNRWKRKIESRIYDSEGKLIKIYGYGERGGFSKSTWNPKDSSIAITSVSSRNYRKLDFIEYFKYDENDKLIESSYFRCRDNKIHHLAYKDIFYHKVDSMDLIVFKENGEIRTKSRVNLKLPKELNDKIYNQKETNFGTKIVLTEKQEFIYDNKNRLVKVLHKDESDNLLGYTKFKYKKIKTW